MRAPHRLCARGSNSAASLRVLVVALLCLGLTLFTVAAPTAAAAATPPSGLTHSADGVSAAVDSLDGEPRVLFIGMAGLTWNDVSATTPALQRFSDSGAIGSNVARSLQAAACPTDGWMALSAGNRAADRNFEGCRELAVTPKAHTVTVDGWDDFLVAAEAGGYAAILGNFGKAFAGSDLLGAGFGPGAAIMLADADGQPVADYAPLPGEMQSLQAPTDTAGQQEMTEQVNQALTTKHLVVLDAGAIREEDPTPRAEQVAAIDARLSATLQAIDDVVAAENAAGVHRPTTVLGVSLADAGTTPQLQVGFAAQWPNGSNGSGTFDTTLLTSSGTRQPGYVQTHDFAATALDRLGLSDSAQSKNFVGSLLTESGDPSSTAERVATLRDDDLKSATVRQAVPHFYTIFIVLNLALYAAISYGLTRIGRRRQTADRDTSAAPVAISVRILTSLRAIALVMSAVPVATYLANLTPWWRADVPWLAVAGLILGWSALIAALCLLGPWRRHLLASVGIVAGITTVVLAVDVMTGARLQLTSLMGTQPLVAGRFYGFNNTAFALLITSSVLMALALTNPLVRRGNRVWAAAIIAGIGIFTTAVDGLPSIGADFGGPPAFIPGFALFTLLALGVRLTWRWAVRIIGLTLVLVTGLLVVDWLRPVDDRTHLGNFFQTVLDGGMWTVVGRKLDQNLQNIFGSWFTLLAVAGLLLVLFALGRPLRAAAKDPEGASLGWLSGHNDLRKIGEQLPLFRAAMLTLAVTLAIGFAVNDSGIIIPALGLAGAIPLLIDLFANWIHRHQLEPTADVSD